MEEDCGGSQGLNGAVEPGGGGGGRDFRYVPYLLKQVQEKFATL
jgi:hypothetical protein